MVRIASVDSGSAENKRALLLDEVQEQLGRTPNLYRSMAQSPATLAGYLAFRSELLDGSLSVQMRERIALLTATLNQCDYCVAAHCFRGGKVGLSHGDLAQTQIASADDPAVSAALEFVASLVNNRGQVPDPTYATMKETGWTWDEIGEIVGHVALNILSNYFSHAADPDLDFPEPRA